jgi:rhodanese-related sulfurtransferase
MNQPVPLVAAAAVPGDGWLLDVRETDEWTAGHVPGATHIPLGEIAQRSDEIPVDQAVYVICRSGNRSGRAAAALNNAGWQAVNVAGGMQDWAAAGLPMVSESGGQPRVA